MSKKYDPSLQRFHLDKKESIAFGDSILIRKADGLDIPGIFCGIAGKSNGRVDILLGSWKVGPSHIDYDYEAGDRIFVCVKKEEFVYERSAYEESKDFSVNDTVIVSNSPIDHPYYGKQGYLCGEIHSEDEGSFGIVAFSDEKELTKVPYCWLTKEFRAFDCNGILCHVDEVVWGNRAVHASQFWIVRKVLPGGAIEVEKLDDEDGKLYTFSSKAFTHVNPESEKSPLFAMVADLCESPSPEKIDAIREELDLVQAMSVFSKLRRQDVQDTDAEAR